MLDKNQNNAIMEKSMRGFLVILSWIFFAPFHWLISAMSRATHRKNSAVQIQITYVSAEAFITSQRSSDEDEPAYLVAAYLLFLSQYFYLCDERQITPAAKCLTEHIETLGSPDQLATLLLYAVRETLTPTERDAFAELFRYPNTPPLSYAEGTPSGSKMAKYSMTTYKTGNHWEVDPRISLGMDIVLLPITVGLLYHYVSDKIGDENMVLLDSCITQFLAVLESSDFRSIREGARSSIANMVIAKNLGV